ncbi:MAG: hypothetical protein AAFW69_02800 [Pseudomonadota bacterium]
MMGEYEYKVVPAPRRAARVRGVRGAPERFAQTLTDLINEVGADGWEYLRAETLPCEEGGSLMRRRVEAYHSVLVFRRARPGARAEVRSEARMLTPEPIPMPAATAIAEPVVASDATDPAPRRSRRRARREAQADQAAEHEIEPQPLRSERPIPLPLDDAENEHPNLGPARRD